MALTYICLDYDPIKSKCNLAEWVETTASLPVDDPAVGDLISAITLLFALSFVFNLLIKFILNKG